jgi:hypothetical protein
MFYYTAVFISINGPTLFLGMGRDSVTPLDRLHGIERRE